MTRIILDNRYGEIMTDNNKIYGYYLINWDGPPYEFQGDTDGFQAGGLVCNARYLNPIEQECHWYTLGTIKTCVSIQHFLTANIDLQKPSSSIKPPNTCNRQDTAQKGSMKLSNPFYNFS